MDKLGRDRLVGGFGGSGGGLILLALFMYLIASPAMPDILGPSIVIGATGTVLLSAAIVIKLTKNIF